MFPFQADELYGQHVHASGGAAPLPKATVFNKRDLALISKVADLIIPATDTPGAVGAGVPYYIDYVVSADARLKTQFQAGLVWLRQGKFSSMSKTKQVAFLEAVSKRAENGENGDPEKFWRMFKSMTADGYYTSKIGLRDELGYLGNTVLDHFPESQIREH